MSLDEYWRKRDFERTLEPRGARLERGRRLARRFVVQRHRASRLHFDLRLELGGVLVSWAVPRGPSMRPLSKRRAARTEDHPIEYLDFEGIIPVGEYGGGDVIVWDQGIWEPEGLDEPGASVEHGELKFVLFGERLKGRFTLVRTHKENQFKEDWLLIHKRDEHSDPIWDINDHTTSLKSGLSNEQIATSKPPAEEPKVASSMADVDLTAARQVPLPSFIRPMLATPVDRPFDDPDWLFELKLDGYRVQAVVHGNAVRLWTRNRKDAAAYFPAFAASSTSWIGAYDAVIDGEMVALDEDGRPSFSLLQDLSGMRGLGAHRGERAPGPGTGNKEPRLGTLVYHAFDLLHLDSWDLAEVPLEERKSLLQLVLQEHHAVRYVSHVFEYGTDFQKAVKDQGLEGSVAKLRSSRYEPGKRSRSWLKVKARREQELVVAGYELGKSDHEELGALLVATYEVEGWRYAGKVGSGIDEQTRKLLRQILDEHRLERSPIVGVSRLTEARWSEPRIVIRAEFAEWTVDGLLRQASFKGREMSRDPMSVKRERVERSDDVREQIAATAPAPAPAKARSETADASEIVPRPRKVAATATFELIRERPGAGTPSEAVTKAELEALATMADKGSWRIGGHTLNLTNLDKVLFPDIGLTKRDLVRYYVTIAPAILPYLRERPLNVHRWPDGVAGKRQFWQKQIPSHAPDWVARWEYPDAGRERSHTYVVADRVATMAWLANQAVIDLHPWTSRLPEYWRPTYAYIDIDPGERTEWQEVLTLARLYRTALGHLGVRGYPKLTGKRGIQIWIAIEPRYTFDHTRDWVGGLSRGIGAVVPDLVSWEWGKADRDGKARLDYTQNAMVKTLVAPYAVRPVPRAAVSAPITWDELDDPTIKPDRWNVRTIIDRVIEHGDLFRGSLQDPQELPPLS